MVSAVESQKSKFDSLFWLLGFVLIGSGIGGYYYFSNQSLLLRVLGLLLALGFAVFVLFRTSQGKYFITQWLEAIQEVRKMVWPTRRETLHTTLAVIGMVLVMGILLWTADFLLLRAVAWLTGQWGG